LFPESTDEQQKVEQLFSSREFTGFNA